MQNYSHGTLKALHFVRKSSTNKEKVNWKTAKMATALYEFTSH
jgi:hypothetical protein